MAPETLIRNTILPSMMLLVVALGMRSAAGDAKYLISRPGLFIRYRRPGVVSRLSTWLNRIGGLLLVLACVPVLVSQWARIRELIGDGTFLAIAAFTVAGLLIGHLLGGPDPDDRSVLALATASRHPAVALAIGSASYPHQTLVPAAILLALVTGIIVSAPYTAWRKRMHASLSGPSIGRP
jgi:BASS family bile acid:Na+ symporter